MSTTLSKHQLQSLCNTAIQAAREAGEWIEKFDRHKLYRQFKNTGTSAASQIVTEVDFRSEEIIRQRLQEVSKPFNIAFVGEESSLHAENKSFERFEKPFYWCVDPLDGTLPYSENQSGYAVSISLIEKSGKPIIGVVYDPANRVLFHAVDQLGCYRNSVAFSHMQQPQTSLGVYADASFRAHERYESAVAALENCAVALNLEGVIFNYGNGAVVNACRVLEHGSACYFKLPKKEDGGGSIWDFAATACITLEAGGWASNIHGQPLALNRPDSTFMNHEGILFASDRQIARCLIDSLCLGPNT